MTLSNDEGMHRSAAAPFTMFEPDLVLQHCPALVEALPLCRGSVITPNVKYQSIITTTLFFDLIKDSTDLMIGVLNEASKHFHEATLERLLFFRNRIP